VYAEPDFLLQILSITDRVVIAEKKYHYIVIYYFFVLFSRQVAFILI